MAAARSAVTVATDRKTTRETRVPEEGVITDYCTPTRRARLTPKLASSLKQHGNSNSFAHKKKLAKNIGIVVLETGSNYQPHT